MPGGATVIVEDDVIMGVESSARYEAPADCPLTTFEGTMLPGLFDAHVHLVSDSALGSLERAGPGRVAGAASPVGDAQDVVTAVTAHERPVLLRPGATATERRTGIWPLRNPIARPSVADCRIGGMPFVVGWKAVIGTARN
jgi:hypothetical protein